MLYSAYYNSPIGRLLLASDGKNLTGLWIEKQKYYADTVPDDIQEQADLPIFIKTREWLDKYFQGKNPAVSELPLAPRGGEFRQAVWKILCQIPQGQVLSYGEIAKMIARQTGKRACPPKPSAELSDITRFQLLFPAIGSSEQTAA